MLPTVYSAPYAWERDFEYLLEFAGDQFDDDALAQAKRFTLTSIAKGYRGPAGDVYVFRMKMLSNLADQLGEARGGGEFFCATVDAVFRQLERK